MYIVLDSVVMIIIASKPMKQHDKQCTFNIMRQQCEANALLGMVCVLLYSKILYMLTDNQCL